MTQAQLAARIGVAQSTISRLERGRGESLSADVWQRAFTAVDRLLVLEGSRDPLEETADAGHLAIQELILRCARANGLAGTFELPTRPSDPSRSADVGIRNDRHRVLELIECWNTMGDIGAGARSTARKVADAGMVAVAGRRGATVPGGVVLGCPGHESQPRAGRTLPGGVRPTVPGIVVGVGQGARRGRGAAHGTGPGLVRRHRDEDLRLETPARLTEGRRRASQARPGAPRPATSPRPARPRRRAPPALPPATSPRPAEVDRGCG